MNLKLFFNKKIFIIFVLLSTSKIFANQLPNSFMPNSLTFNNGNFIVGGQNSQSTYSEIYFSPDGNNWTQSSFPSVPSGFLISSIVCNNGLACLAVIEPSMAVNSTTSYLYSSSDGGITWGNSPYNSAFYQVSYGNGKFVVSYNSANTPLVYSSDGINWYAANVPTGSGSLSYYVSYGNGYYEAVGFATSTDILFGKSIAILRSSDGVNWNSIDITTTPLYNAYLPDYPSTANSNIFYTIGSTINGPYTLATTVNGSSFTTTSESGISVVRGINNDPTINRLYSQNSFGHNIVSLDQGQTWWPLGMPNNLNYEPLFDFIAYGNNMYLASPGPGVGYIFSSTDGVNWQTVFSSSSNLKKVILNKM